MNLKSTVIFLVLVCTFLSKINAQAAREKGRIIKEFGPTFKVENKDIETNTAAELKVIFDVSQSSSDKSVTNKYIETAARFLNMHANEGMKAAQLHVAMTIHGSAWQDILTDEAYQEKFGVPNPNSQLIKALNKAGVDVILCGQTASFRDVTSKMKLPEVKLALSAMTALLQYQDQGYRFIKF